MPDPIALSFTQLPLDVLHCIFYYLDIPDILRIRRVSRYLNGVSHSRDIWSDVYRRPDFVRPPGPFLSQSADDLELALIPSFRVHQNLRCDGGSLQEKRKKLILKPREIRYRGVHLRVNLVFGQFLFVALSEEVRCYDLNLDALDSNSGASIVYRSTGGTTLKSFHSVSSIDVKGRPFSCAVLGETTPTSFSVQDTTQISIYLLNVVEGSEINLELLHQFENDVFDIDAVDLGPRVIVIQGRVGPDANSDWRLVALDVHTRTQFLLPSFIHAMWEATEMPDGTTIREITSPTSVSTSTHLLLARSFYTRAIGWSTFIQAFTLPNPSTRRATASSPLHPSHRSIIPGINVRDIVLLQDAARDLPTQDVLITIRVHTFESCRPRCPLSKYGILRLNAEDDGLGTITFHPLGLLGQHSQMPFLYPSLNGVGRAFYRLELSSVDRLAAFEYDVRCGGSPGDRDRDDDRFEAVGKVVEYPAILQFSSLHTLLDYDPYSGRICLHSDMGKYNLIEIFDLAV